MAHEIDQTTGRAAVFTAGAAPWHRLGVNVAEAQTSDQAIELAGLNWEVEQWPLSATNGEETRVACTEQVANVRTDTHAVLGVVGKSYRVFQNRQAFDFMDALVGERLAMFETAGSLKGGRQVWMLAKIPAELRVSETDLITPYALLSNSHDGSRALRIIPTAVRVVCQNTLTLALGRGASEGVVVRHCESLTERVAEARRALSIVTERLKGHEAEAQQLHGRQVSVIEVNEYFRKVVGTTELREAGKQELYDRLWRNLSHATNTVDGMQETAWGAYNAVSFYADHQTRSVGNAATRDERRLSSIWFGSSSRLKQHAYDFALQLAGV